MTMFSSFWMANAGSTAFSVDNSILFNDDDEEYLTLTPSGTATSRKIFTLSAWVKRGNLGTNLPLFSARSGANSDDAFNFNTSDQLELMIDYTNDGQLTSDAKFRDPHAWYHVVCAIDTTQPTAANRVKIYVNNEQLTTFSPSSYPSLGYEFERWQVAGNTETIGRTLSVAAGKADGYMAQVIKIDGRQLTPSSFGEADDNGVWRPIKVADSGLLTVSSTAEAIANVASATSSSGITAYTFSGVALGTASATRAVYVFVTAQEPGTTAPDVQTLTVGGVSASKVQDVSNSVEPEYYASELWRADVPSGTTGDIVVTWNTAMSQCGVIAWAVTGEHVKYDIKTDLSSTSASLAFTGVPDGSVILAGRGGTGGKRVTWGSDVTENIDEDIASGVIQSGASSAKSTGGDFTVTCARTDGTTDSRPRTFAIVLSPSQGAGNFGYYLPFTDSSNLGGDYKTGGITSITLSGEWNGDTGDFGTLDTDIIATGGNQGAIRTNDTFTGDFAFDFTWKGGSNPAYVGVYEIDEDGTFSTGSSDGGMGSMTDSFYLFFTSGNAVNALKGSSTESSSIFTAASGEVIKFQRSGSQFKVFEDGVLRHTFTGTSSNEVRILVGQSSSSLDWENFRWVTGGTTLGNPFAPVNAPTQTTDSPTTNAATFSPLITRHQTSFDAVTSDWTFTNGNRTLTHTSGSSGDIMAAASQLLQPGQKYHFEAVTESMHSSAYARFQLALVPQSMWETDASPLTGANDQFTFSLIKSGGTGSNTAAFDNGSLTAPTNKPTTNSRLTFEVDMSTIGSTTVRYYFDGSLDTTYSSLAFANEPYYVVSFTGTETDRNGVFNFNFGSSAFTDTPTSGHTGLTAKDAFAGSAPTIEDGSAYLNTITYAGSNSEQSITGVGFTPDMYWVKNRGSGDHVIYDRVRAAGKAIYPSLPNDEDDSTAHNPSLDADGITFGGNYTDINKASNNYVLWNWLAGGSGSSNTEGRKASDSSVITSTVSVNQTAGFSIVSWQGNGENSTIGHGLGVAPSWILIKNRADADSWVVYHDVMGATKGAALDGNGIPATASTFFNDTAPSPTVFSVGSGGRTNGSTDAMIAYCWCEKPGFSKFGSYEGNGNSSDGPYVHLGFTPQWLMIKGIDQSANSWMMYDNVREPNNPKDLDLAADTSNAEDADMGSNGPDFLSNGFKFQSSGTSQGNLNVQDKTFIYMAFAEHPFAGTTPATAR